MGRKRRVKLPQEPVEVEIEGLSHEGRGVAHVDGKTVFIHGALNGEKVLFRYTKRQRRHDEGVVVEVLEASPERIEPKCVHFDICGGCSLQHLSAEAQIRDKQQILLDALSHIGKVEPEMVLTPLTSESHWGYRKKARLGVKDVPKKGRVLVGFREKSSAFIADVRRCEVLDPKIGGLLEQLSELIGGLSISNQIPQIEVAMGDSGCVLIFRILDQLNDEDTQALREFGRRHEITMAIQPGGPDTVAPLSEGAELSLSYRLPGHDVEVHFQPNDFTQVNSDINRQMVSRALKFLDLSSEDKVLDLFCGLGNFTLPMARQAAQVTGVEGDAGLVSRARDNAGINGLDNVNYYTANLYEELQHEPWLKEKFSKVLLDPPRSGAAEVLPHLPKVGAERIVYVSCYPATLARDAGILVNELGYRLVSAGVMDMFPHTAHVESIALFEKK